MNRVKSRSGYNNIGHDDSTINTVLALLLLLLLLSATAVVISTEVGVLSKEGRYFICFKH